MTKDVVNKLEIAYTAGANDTQACDFADISRTTLYKYINEQERRREGLSINNFYSIIRANKFSMGPSGGPVYMRVLATPKSRSKICADFASAIDSKVGETHGRTKE